VPRLLRHAASASAVPRLLPPCRVCFRRAASASAVPRTETLIAQGHILSSAFSAICQGTLSTQGCARSRVPRGIGRILQPRAEISAICSVALAPPVLTY
jgi:hypothetical protein